MARAILNMDCDRALEVLYLIEDRGFDPSERSAFELHLERCHPCRDRAHFSSRVIHLVRERARREAAPPRLRIRILSSFAHRSIA